MSLGPGTLFAFAALCVLTLALGCAIAVLFRLQVRTQEEKRRSDSRYRSVVEQAGDSILLVDAATGRLTEANYSLRRRLGYSAEEIERQQFVVHYHPQIAIATRRIVALEALVRWAHPRLGLVPPSKFIPIAEESGLIVPIGEHIRRQPVCGELTIRRQRVTDTGRGNEIAIDSL